MTETAPLSISRGGDRREIRATAATAVALTPVISAATISAAATPANGVRMIDGIYRITGRAEPMIVFAAPHPTLPLEKPTDRSAHAVAAE